MPSPLNLLVATLGSLALIGSLASPAAAAPRVTTPYITASSTSTLTIAWPKVAGKAPARTWNGHIDRIFIRGSMGSTRCRVVS